MASEKSKRVLTAYDPGFGNVKVGIDGAVGVVQNAVSIPTMLGFSGTGMKVAKKPTIVRFDGLEFAIGQGAWKWGEVLMSYDWSGLVTPEQNSLLYGGLSMILNPGNYDLDLVVGLPVLSLSSDETGKEMIERLRALKREHIFSVDDQKYSVTISRIRVLAQPVGSYYEWLYDDKGKQRNDASAKVAVVDIGQNTVDIYGLQDGSVDPRYVGGSKSGARRLLMKLRFHGPLSEADYLVATRKIKPLPSERASWIAEILGDIESTLGNLSWFETIILTGGGVRLVEDELKNAVENRGGKVYIPDNPIIANCLGFYRWAKSVSK